ncbi:TadE/TadG family type IV pilus assembly protein [Myceligenerans indicum]|uniref:Pilus assembly protein n=1 Tax=Myceligenerans indicum TaxID=2593663 RepID=A0ABS1LF78_9MICO|nr:TadE/TadG family type IV pilus assembly protein [Myceligenerans indicum]MBL0884848.1 pilus assembly protein [Myceligenerans indicum]
MTVSGPSERGSASIQYVFILPALFTLMFAFVQGAMYYQGKTIAIAAAEEGARIAASEGGTLAEGQAAARLYVANTTVGLSGTLVSGAGSADQVTITVTTHTVSLVPAWSPTVVQSASLPVERITG